MVVAGRKANGTRFPALVPAIVMNGSAFRSTAVALEVVVVVVAPDVEVGPADQRVSVLLSASRAVDRSPAGVKVRPVVAAEVDQGEIPDARRIRSWPLPLLVQMWIFIRAI